MGTLQTLDRGIEALFLVASRPGGTTVAAIADELGIARANAYRIVVTLEHHGLIRRDARGSLRLGGAMPFLAAAFWPGFLEQIRPVLQRLADASGATSYLSLAEGEDCVVVATAEPTRPILRVGYRVGSRHPLNVGAAGIAILAARAPLDSDSTEVRRARENGYSITRGQLQPGAVGVAMAVSASESSGAELSVGIVALEGIDVPLALDEVRRATGLIAALT